MTIGDRISLLNQSKQGLSVTTLVRDGASSFRSLEREKFHLSAMKSRSAELTVEPCISSEEMRFN